MHLNLKKLSTDYMFVSIWWIISCLSCSVYYTQRIYKWLIYQCLNTLSLFQVYIGIIVLAISKKFGMGMDFSETLFT